MIKGLHTDEKGNDPPGQSKHLLIGRRGGSHGEH